METRSGMLEIGKKARFESTLSCDTIIGIIEIHIGSGIYLLSNGLTVHAGWFLGYLEGK